MEKDRKIKIIAIVALFIGVATMTVGFAAFSSKLIIQSKAKVTPDVLEVVFSTEKYQETGETITPTGNGEIATIDNSGDPTITNLIANFTRPGQRVEYEFYAVNTGNQDAYLNKIEYENVTGQTTNKVCTADEGTNQSQATSACNDIRITVQVENAEKACQTSTYTSHKLGRRVGEKIIITIEYDKNGAMADGPFEVEFGNVTLNYSITDSETKNVPTCTAYETQIAVTPHDDLDNDGQISKSDIVRLGTEAFYVINTDEAAGTVTMLAEWNLNVGENTVEGSAGMQNSACKGFIRGLSESEYKCGIAFSSTNYWSSTTTYPAWVYNEQSSLYTHVENYVNELRKLGYSSVTGRLIKHDELVSLGCSSAVGEESCSDALEWVKNTSYWTGSAFDTDNTWAVSTDGYFGFHLRNDNRYCGVRPVITIKESEI